MSQIYVTATLSTKNKKIAIKAEDIKKALEIERELYNIKTQKIINVRMSKSKPKLIRNNEVITDLASIEDSREPYISNK